MQLNRKSFIKQSLLASLALSAPGGWPSYAADSEERRALPGRKFSMQLNGGLIGVKANQSTLIDLASQNGFESVVALPQQLGKLSDAQTQDLQADMKSKKVSFGMGELNVEFRKSDEIFKNALATLPVKCATLQRVGVTRSMTWIMSNHSELNYLQNFRLHQQRLREIANILNNYGIRLGLEYVGPKSIWAAAKFPFIHTLAETRELIAAINQPNVGIHLDTAHWFTSGETLDTIRGLTNKDVVGCDLNDALPGISPLEDQPGYQRELPVATGVINLKGFLEALISIGYDGFVQAEPFNDVVNQLDDGAAVQKTAESMKKALALIGS
ncbi:sugar phosphate isomerase/epimerase [Spirosoma flavus]